MNSGNEEASEHYNSDSSCKSLVLNFESDEDEWFNQDSSNEMKL